ncbi:hypothetical protein [Rhizobium sp. CECT 9324]|uniref:hypothetical protein n=1 Tax=Rhizobium sp. CECT 9324 TaxID=2845820 RepID=UPI001E3C9827|nr:hypothetical protein [Rhizobium sp. CECT 9324]CAH0339607.1 hypothetical protein RHI9324_01258 [Rhizobium sp. CECT 9324]
MSCEPIPSTMLAAVRAALSRYEAKGVLLQPPEVRALLRNLRTIEELTRNQEEELEIRAEMLRIKADRPDPAPLAYTGVIIPMPRRRPALRVAGSPDGGDAA